MRLVPMLLRMLLVSALFLVAATAGAQDTEGSTQEVSETISAENVEETLARMSDDEVRAWLIEKVTEEGSQSDTAQSSGQGIINQISALWTAFATPFSTAVEVLPNVPEKLDETFTRFTEEMGGAGVVTQWLVMIAAILTAGFLVEWVVRRFFPIQQPDETSDGDGLWTTLQYLWRRFLSEFVGLVAFYVVIRVLGRALLPLEHLEYGAIFVLHLIWIPRLFSAMARVVLSPKRPSLRLVNADDATAHSLQRGLTFVVFWAGLTIAVFLFVQKTGVRPGDMRLGVWMDSVVYILMASIIWKNRDGLQRILIGDGDDFSGFDQKVAKFYPIYGLIVVALTFCLTNVLSGLGQVASLVKGAHYTTMATLLLAPLADTSVRGLVGHLAPPMTGTGSVAEAAHRATKRSFINIGRVFVIGLALIIIANAWGFSLADLLTETTGIGDNLFRFLMTLVVGYLVYEGSSVYINRRLQAEITAIGMTQEEADNEMGGGGGSRLSTVLPLVLATSRGLIVVVFGLLAIGNLGIDITPLLAGAGIAGLAIGFGAQKLVTDVVSGVFFLIDDAFRVGEYVEIEGTMGAVEKISIRSMQLRHHRGPVHTIPYGEIPKLTNYSRDWVIMKLKFTVQFDTDPNKVKKVFKKIGAEMMADELYKDDFLQPFKSQGVFDIDDVGMVMRGKFMAKPGKQFMIRKEIYNRVKAEFEANDISFARREVRVAIPGAEDMSDEERHQAGLAAAAAATASADAETKSSGGT
ncbi:MAG: mechanosensitive ion channel domain-containing protein [Pseudomonadota bacterium]